ncbi:MAG: elongation factor G, partial [Aquificota bacterium]
VEILPSPQERPPVKGIDPNTGEETERKCSTDEPLAALVFKTISDPYAGKITLFKVFSGVLEGDSTVYNTAKETKERVGKPFFMVGKEQKPTDKVIAGDIGAVAKLKETSTGDTLCAPDAPFLFPPIPFPEPILSFAIQAKSRSDEEKISSALQRLMEEDPGLKVKRDEQTKELIISGLGQLHLETIVERLKRKYGVEVELQTPKVPYKETIKKKVKMQGRYKKQTGGRGQYGDVWIEVEPLPRGTGFEFEDRIVGGAIPRQYIPSVEKGIRGAMQEGVLAGYPVVDVKVVLYDGSFHPVDSSDLAFQIAGSMAFKKAAAQANPTLLEPIMTLEVIAPDDCVGDVIGDLNAKRGKILGVEAKGKNQIIRAQVPLAEILRYAPELRSITGGRGTYSMEFSHYEEVPPHLAQKIIEESKGEEGES